MSHVEACKHAMHVVDASVCKLVMCPGYGRTMAAMQWAQHQQDEPTVLHALSAWFACLQGSNAWMLQLADSTCRSSGDQVACRYDAGLHWLCWPCLASDLAISTLNAQATST